MDFSEVVGHSHLKSHLLQTIKAKRVAHAQLFSGTNGSGLLPMALAYASALLCNHYEEGSAAYEDCKRKVKQLDHPDLHFVYPVNSGPDKIKDPISDHYAQNWREFIATNPYASLFEWLQFIGVGNKVGNIGAKEADAISKKLALKSYDGGYKVMIIWMAEHMNSSCSNKILKLIEEPSEKTVLILLAEREDQILTTILSRCQRLAFPPLAPTAIATLLEDALDIPADQAQRLATRAQGDYNKALQLFNAEGEDTLFEGWFIQWVRTAFQARGNKASIIELLKWSETLAAQGRETQKRFLLFANDLFRQAFLKNYKVDPLILFEPKDQGFSLDKFAPFVHANNIYDIHQALEEAYYHVDRNAHGKTLFSDLSIQLTRYIHQKPPK